MLPSANDVHTAEDYWSLPDGVRAELIDGQLYDMIPPSPIHQLLVTGMATDFTVYVRRHGGACKVMVSPVAVNLDADDTAWVEPDVVVVCDPAKLSARGVEGAPDLVVEVVSPSSCGMDYVTKLARYKKRVCASTGSSIPIRGGQLYTVLTETASNWTPTRFRKPCRPVCSMACLL